MGTLMEIICVQSKWWFKNQTKQLISSPHVPTIYGLSPHNIHDKYPFYPGLLQKILITHFAFLNHYNQLAKYRYHRPIEWTKSMAVHETSIRLVENKDMRKHAELGNLTYLWHFALPACFSATSIQKCPSESAQKELGYSSSIPHKRTGRSPHRVPHFCPWQSTRCLQCSRIQVLDNILGTINNDRNYSKDIVLQ